jgi:hypothetical protein
MLIRKNQNMKMTIARGILALIGGVLAGPLSAAVLPDTTANGVVYLTYDRAAWATIAASAFYTDIHSNPTGASGPSADSNGQRWMFPDRLEGTNWVAATYPADYLTPLPDSPLQPSPEGFVLPVNTYVTNAFATNHKISSYNSTSNTNGYIGLGGSFRATSDFNQPGASVWWEHLALRQDPEDSIWKLYATSGPGQGSLFELRNVTEETINGHLHLSADYVFGNTEWLHFFQDVNGHLDTNAILGHIELVPDGVARVVAGWAIIHDSQDAWEALASGFAPPPVLTLSALFSQGEASALTQSQLLTNVQAGASYANQIYAMNGRTVTNLPSRYAQPTSFLYPSGDLAQHTGQIGLGGVARFGVLGGVAGSLLFGDYTLQYDASRLALGGTGWYLLGNIPPAAAAFDLLNVRVLETPETFSISGDLGVSFEVANFLFATPSDTLKVVGNFSFTGYVVTPPPPSLAVVSRQGNAILLRAINGIPGTSFTLLSADRVTLPRGSWTTTASGTFDASGVATIALPFHADQTARFYALIQP